MEFYTIKFGELSAIALDFVDSSGDDGFLYLRLLGDEVTLNSIWSRLVASRRGKKWSTNVHLVVPGSNSQLNVGAQKGVRYRVQRVRLPESGLIDLALIHPNLTLTGDNERGFYLLTYENDPARAPAGFFDRLNRALAIPLKPEWADWLWELGQRRQSWPVIKTESAWEPGNRSVQTEVLREIEDTPIYRMGGLGQVACYRVRCQSQAREAWLHLIRTYLKLGIVLKPTAESEATRLLNGHWAAYQTPQGWALHKNGQEVLTAPSLQYLLIGARQSQNLHFMVEGGK